MSQQLAQFRQLKMQVQRKLHQCLGLAQDHFKQTFPMPNVMYDLRGVKAGVAYLQQNEIRLNKTLLLENPVEFIQQVVPHELAHLLVYQLFGNVKPHGKEWQNMMQQLFHLPALTCHQFDTKNVRGKTFAYHCECQTHHLSSRRHQRILQQQMHYICRQCGSPLVFGEKASKNKTAP